MDGSKTAGQKRRSRFDGDGEEDGDAPQPKKSVPVPALDITAAAAKAAEISRELSSRIAAMSSILGQINASKTEKKQAYRTLRLDDQGREIDEHGNLVKQDMQQIKTLAANMAATAATQKKKENPYLSHRAPGTAPDGADEAAEDEVVDERLPARRRDAKVRKALQFVEPGKYVKEEIKIKEKEERKLIAGYTSGRKTLGRGSRDPTDGAGAEVTGDAETPTPTPTEQALVVAALVAPLADSAPPAMEWWDEPFLSKQKREQRKLSKAAADQDDFELLALVNNRTHKYIQHPLPIKPLVAEAAVKPLPMFLTKKERKKLRKASRAEREREKRDKMMLGLIAAPEPKFKLSNFMKILGDQAVADPSKVELKVLQQMQQRVLNHEMRNQAAKLTPKERREKKLRKLQEDTSKGTQAAAFRVTNFSSLKHRFKVDVNAQQLFLSGLVLLCEEDAAGGNLVVVEGGPRAIRKFIRLMTERIDWTAVHQIQPADEQVKMAVGEQGEWNYVDVAAAEALAASAAVEGVHMDADEAAAAEAGDDDDDDDDVDDSEDEDEDSDEDSAAAKDQRERRCDLLWTGSLPRKIFNGFKYQEAKSSYAARKLLEGKNAAHYWDMLINADQLLASHSVDMF